MARLNRVCTYTGSCFFSTKKSTIRSASSSSTLSRDFFPNPKSFNVLRENRRWDFQESPSLKSKPTTIARIVLLLKIYFLFYANKTFLSNATKWNHAERPNLEAETDNTDSVSYNYGAKWTIRKGLKARCFVTTKKLPVLAPNKNIKEETLVDPHDSLIRCVFLTHSSVINLLLTLNVVTRL